MGNVWDRTPKQGNVGGRIGYNPPPPDIQARVEAELGPGIYADLAARFNAALEEARDPGATLTSWWRSPEEQASYIKRGMTKAVASLHGLGLATDIVPSSLAARDRLYAALRAHGFYVIPERKGGAPTTLQNAYQLHAAAMSAEKWARSPLATYMRELVLPLLR